MRIEDLLNERISLEDVRGHRWHSTHLRSGTSRPPPLTLTEFGSQTPLWSDIDNQARSRWTAGTSARWHMSKVQEGRLTTAVSSQLLGCISTARRTDRAFGASATSWEHDGMPSLAKTCERWIFALPAEMNMRSPIWRLVRWAAMWRTTTSSMVPTADVV